MWGLLIRAVKNSKTRRAALGVGVNRDVAGESGAVGERMSPVPAVIPCPSKLVSLICGAFQL